LILLMVFAASLHAQTPPVSPAQEEAGGVSAAATTNDSGPIGIIPVTRGFNASLGTSSQHDSSNGWSSLLTRMWPTASTDISA